MRFRLLFILLVACVTFPERSPAPVVFKAGQRAKYVAPGEEEVNGTARELFDIAQQAERDGNNRRAVKAYQKIVRKYKRDVLAPEAAYRTAVIQEKTGSYVRSAEAYQYVAQNYPQSSFFDEAIEGQFRIGELFLNGKKRKFLGISISNRYGTAVQIFASVIRSAPYGKYTARAQFDIGLAREKQGINDAAIAAYQEVIDKFPDNPLAADAQYQIGYIWYQAERAGAQDPNAVSKAKQGFEDFLYRYPHSEKAPQAQENLRRLETKQTSDSFNIAKFYDKQKNYRAAVIYYNEVIRQQPGSPQSDKAKVRVDQLRAKVGDAALAPPIATHKKQPHPTGPAAAGPAAGRSEAPAMRTSPEDVSPLPPPENDVSLPPPASLAPDTTTAPAGQASPEPSATPEASASPSP